MAKVLRLMLTLTSLENLGQDSLLQERMIAGTHGGRVRDGPARPDVS